MDMEIKQALLQQKNIYRNISHQKEIINQLKKELRQKRKDKYFRELGVESIDNELNQIGRVKIEKSQASMEKLQQKRRGLFLPNEPIKEAQVERS